MEAGHGNRSFSKTPPFSAPLSSSPESYLPLYHSLEPAFAGTSIQNNPFGENPFDQILEAAFSRLNVSTHQNQELSYHGLDSGEFLDRSRLNVSTHQNQELSYLNCSSLSDLRGWFVSLAKDKYGSCFLQRAMEKAPKEEIGMILMEVIDHVCELMTDPFANYVVQKLVDMCSMEQRSHILLMVVKDGSQLVNICLNVHGTRAVQNLLENLTTQPQISLVMSALSPVTVALTKDMNGHRVIQCCLKNFSDEHNKYLLNEVANSCYQIATDKSGCFVLQQCVEHPNGEARVRIVREIIANALHLAQDQYGNYVVQHVLGLKEPQITANVVRQLEGNYATLSCNRHGSNVVEKCLVESGEHQSTRIIMELLKSPIASRLLVDPFGNYVIQTALSVSKGFVYGALLNLVRVNSPLMQSHVHGKCILAWFNKRKKPHM
ncbi:hypothetical protein PTKIN_Ptkin09bG0144600 [Pterospermum kingtungense]